MVVKADDMKLLETPEDVFKYFRKKFYIDDTYTDEEAYKIMTIKYDMLIKDILQQILCLLPRMLKWKPLPR